jgi:hypothetical protein
MKTTELHERLRSLLLLVAKLNNSLMTLKGDARIDVMRATADACGDMASAVQAMLDGRAYRLRHAERWLDDTAGRGLRAVAKKYNITEKP